LLDTYFESTEIVEIGTLVRSYYEITREYFDLLFIFRERRYFEKERESNFLLFPYLSFEISQETGLHTFVSHTDLSAKMAQLQNDDRYFVRQSRNCIVFFRRDMADEHDYERMFNITKRLFVFFYQNSGSRAQFLKSISDRAMREYWSGKKYEFNFSTASAYISNLLGIGLSLYFIGDEINPDALDPLEGLNPIYSSTDSPFTNILNDERSSPVRRDIFDSVVRKRQNFGEYMSQLYCVSPLIGSHLAVADDQEIRSYRIRPEYVSLYWGVKNKISLDEVNVANSFLLTFFQFNDDFQESQFRNGIENACRKLERDLSSSPVSNIDDLRSRYTSILSRIFSNERAMAGICPVIVRLYNPATKSLESVFDTIDIDDGDDIELSVPIDDIYAACSFTFLHDRLINVWHREKLNRESAKEIRTETDQHEEIQWQKSTGSSIRNFIGRTGVSIISHPVRINGILIGTIEFSSASRLNLYSYSNVVENLAELCGDIYRRIELANDRGWLVRMQFLHAARHRIEQIIAEVQEVAPDAAHNLRDFIQSANVDEDEEKNNILIDTKECIKELVERCQKSFDGTITDTAANSIFGKLNVLSLISRRNALLLTETLGALAANVRKHGFRADGISLFAGTRFGRHPIICLSYKPIDSWEQYDRMQRVCVSPIPNKIGLNKYFSYGLFLLATQVRMAGGWIVAHTAEPDSVDQVHFGFSVFLNAETEREDD